MKHPGALDLWRPKFYVDTIEEDRRVVGYEIRVGGENWEVYELERKSRKARRQQTTHR